MYLCDIVIENTHTNITLHSFNILSEEKNILILQYDHMWYVFFFFLI